MINLLIAEQRKIFRRAFIWVLLAVLVATTLAGNIIQLVMMPADLNSPEAQGTIQNLTLPHALAILPSLGSAAGQGSLLVVILVGVLLGQEYRWRSLHLWLSQGFPRAWLIWAKYLVLIMAGFLIVITPVLVGGIHAIYLTQQYHGSLNLAEIDVLQVMLSLLRGLYTLLPYIALGLFLAVMTRSTVAPVAGGILFVLIVESLAGQLLPLLGENWAMVAQFTPQNLATNLMIINQASHTGMTEIPLLDPWIATIGIGVYTIFFLGATLLVFRRQDLHG